MTHARIWLKTALVTGAFSAALASGPAWAASPGESERARHEAMADTFLAAGDFPNAMNVINKALQRDPDNTPMKLRLARVLEWAGNPSEAYHVWKALADAGVPEAAAAVARLAPSVGDSETHLALLQQRLRAGGFRQGDIEALVQGYEHYGHVSEGLHVLRAMFDQTGNKDVLASLAYLHEQSGDITEAIRLHRLHLSSFGFERDRAVRLAELLISRGEWRDALDLLRNMYNPGIPPEHRYWELYAGMAWELQQTADAERAYRILLARKEISIESAERLAFLVFRESPEAAARIALDAYQKNDDVRLVTLGLQYLVTDRRISAARSELDRIPQSLRRSYEQNKLFAMISGLVATSSKRYDEALRLYRSVLQRSPEDADAREAVLWVLIEKKDLRMLVRALGAWQDGMKSSRRHYLVLASAYSALNRFDDARRYYRLYQQEAPDDRNLRLTHADMFDQISRPDIQTRLRSELFRDAMVRYQKGTLKPGTTDHDILLGSLALAFMPNNKLAGYFESVRKRNDAAAQPENALHELWLTWALNAGHEEAAMRMMRLRDASSSTDANPLWSRLLLALKQKDVEAAGAMLDTDYRLLPGRDRIDAAIDARRYHLAEDLAFETMSARNNDHDHETHERFSNLVTQHRNQLDVSTQYESRDLFHSLEVRSAYLFRAANDWWLKPWASTARLTLKNTGLLTDSHLTDNRAGVQAIKRSPKLDAELNAYHRDAWQSFPAAEISLTGRYNEAFAVTVSAGLNAFASLSDPLIAAGMRDFARLEAHYAFSLREYVNAAVGVEHLMLQDRSSMGTGVRYELTFGYRAMIEYPDLTVRIPMQLYSMRQKSGLPTGVTTLLLDPAVLGSDFFVPRSNKQIGVGLDLGASVRDSYTKAWRPFAAADLVYNDVYRGSGSVMLGAAGSIEGRDHMMISAERGFGKGFATPATLLRIQYSFYF